MQHQPPPETPTRDLWRGLTASAWDELSEDERSDLLLVKQSRGTRAERRKKTVERLKRINTMVLEGRTVAEISEIEGMTVRALRRLGKRHGVVFQGKPYHRRIPSGWLPYAASDALDELAVDMKTDPGAAVIAILEWALDSDAVPIRRELRIVRRARVAEAV